LDIYIDVKAAAEISSEHVTTIRRNIKKGEYKARIVESSTGSKTEVLLSSLSPEAQLKYYQKINEAQNPKKHKEIDIDMAAYKEKFGEDGVKELVFKYEIVQKAIEIGTKFPKEKTKLCEELAKENNIGKRSLDRWMQSFIENGTAGLMKKLERNNKGKRTSICLEAQRYMMDKYLTKAKRKKTVIHEMLLDYAEISGPEACKNCMYREGTEARKKMELNLNPEDCINVPVCYEEYNGLIVTNSSKTLSRILKEDVSNEIVDFARKGRKYWEAAYMQKAIREKPNVVNECWFGDHHVFDVFVYDDKGNIAKPWITAWYDIGSGCLVGWCLSMNPNSRTIAEALTYGILEKPDVPFCGVPSIVYTDNGKDYRSHVFEGGQFVEVDHGKMEYNIETEGILKQLHIQNIHAKAYHGWAKPVERWFKTIEERYIRELPGWCGNNPNERPEGFDKDVKRMAEKGELLSLDEFKVVLTSKILPAYHERPHSGYNNEKPIERYMKLEKARYDMPSKALLAVIKMECVERDVTTQGIRFENKIYWHKELMHLANERVKVKYNKEQKDVLIIMHNDRFVCAATVRDKLKMVNEDADLVAENIQLQKRQENDVIDRICELKGIAKPKRRKIASANVMTGETIETESNITSIEHEKAMKEYTKALEPKEVKGDGKIKKRFERIGEEIFERDAISS